jgi:uncharacterized protein YPO0396
VALAETAQARLADLDNALTEEKIAFRRLKDEHAALTAEIKSLKGRRSNLPARMTGDPERLVRSPLDRGGDAAIRRRAD